VIVNVYIYCVCNIIVVFRNTRHRADWYEGNNIRFLKMTAVF